MRGTFQDGSTSRDHPGGDELARFDTTQWSLVLGVVDTAPASAAQAMERLCARYWHPIHAAIVRQVRDHHKADDQTQAFFEFVIRGQLFEKARQDRGRFRSFILTSLKHFLHNEHDHACASKRGGSHPHVSISELPGEDIAPAPPGAPFGACFDREWALALIRRVMEQLRAECLQRGRIAVHDGLIPYLTASPADGEIARLAERLDMAPATVKVALHRLRHRFGELLRREVAHTVQEPAEVDEELRYLLSVLADI